MTMVTGVCRNVKTRPRVDEVWVVVEYWLVERDDAVCQVANF